MRQRETLGYFSDMRLVPPSLISLLVALKKVVTGSICMQLEIYAFFTLSNVMTGVPSTGYLVRTLLRMIFSLLENCQGEPFSAENSTLSN